MYPDRFFDVGIAEEHAVTFAAGMAMGGYKPVVCVYSSFLQRAYDQIIHDVCIQDLPVVFAIWIMIEGIVIAVQSFDYKRVGFPMWWVLLLLGAGAAVLGYFGLKNLDVTAGVLSALIGLAIIANGLAYILAVVGVNRFEKRVDRLGRIIDIDEQ